MAITADMVKRLREETDAPMMECKTALTEAGGDFDKARDILREKGKAAAAKRADRSTSEGIALFVANDEGTKAAGILLECETDFVAKNEEFIKLAGEIARNFLTNAPAAEPADTPMGDGTVAERIQAGVALIRENIVLKKVIVMDKGPRVAVYNHHDRKKASAVTLEGQASNIMDTGYQIAIQTVAFSPTFLKKEDVPQDVIAREIEIETQRAINEGKAPDIAAKAAQGRVHKEFYQSQVLLEQPFYLDNKKTVGQFIAEESKVGGGPVTVLEFVKLAVGDE